MMKIESTPIINPLDIQASSSTAVAADRQPPQEQQQRTFTSRFSKRIRKLSSSMMSTRGPAATAAETSAKASNQNHQKHKFDHFLQSQSQTQEEIESSDSSRRKMKRTKSADDVRRKSIRLAIKTSFSNLSLNSSGIQSNSNLASASSGGRPHSPTTPSIAALVHQKRRRKLMIKQIIPKSETAKHIAGLKNLGNTCFMNSALQCLFSSDLLLSFFLHDDYLHDLNSSSPNRGHLASAFADVVKKIWSKQQHHHHHHHQAIANTPSSPQASTSSSTSLLSTIKSAAVGKGRDCKGGGNGQKLNMTVNPKLLRTQFAKYAPDSFSRNRQEDAQEFLRFLLDGMHEDLNRVKVKPKIIYDEDVESKLGVVEKANLSWNRYHSINDSFIFDLFGGQLESTITCQTCQYTSTTFDTFWDLSLPIPQQYHIKEKRAANNNSVYKSKKSCSLQDCLKCFAQEEILDGDESYHCPRCKSPQSATKYMRIYRMPPVLLLQIKRFTQTIHGREKLTTEVNYPLVLDGLEEMIKSPIEGSDRGRKQTYQLNAVCCHYGGLTGGHYEAMCKNIEDDQWYLFNDHQVTKTDFNVYSQSAYLLFYKLVIDSP